MFWQDLPSRLVTRQNSIQWLQELRSTAQSNPAVNSLNDHGCSLSCYHLSPACNTKRFWLPSELGCPIPYPELSYQELVAELCRKLGSRMYGLPHVQVLLSSAMEHKKILEDLKVELSNKYQKFSPYHTYWQIKNISQINGYISQ